MYNKVSSININFPNNQAAFGLYQERQLQLDSTKNNKQNEGKSNVPNVDKDPSYKYTVKFKKEDMMAEFRKFYKIYGPLFIVCHIGVSLVSLGSFCTLVWLTVDLSKLVPEFMTARLGTTMMNMTGEGGKFVLAYAVHKMLLPFRIGFSFFLTKLLAPKVSKLKMFRPKDDITS